MNSKTKGTICGIIAAISYGTNPLGALNLYNEGINVNSVLFYRYGIAALLLMLVLILKRETLKISLKEIKIVALLGILFATSSITLFTSFHFMDAGVASTILFVYPIMVAILMAVCFKEKISFITIFSIVLALSGITLLYSNGDGAPLSSIGVALVLVSALTYAFYIIVVNKAPLKMSPLKLTFYVLIFCLLTIVIYSTADSDTTNHIQMLYTAKTWGYSIMLAIVPTIISLLTMTVAVHILGSTPTAIMGALEPLTAVVVGVTIFGEALSINLILGILMILCSVILIIGGQSISTKRILAPIYKLNRIGRHKY